MSGNLIPRTVQLESVRFTKLKIEAGTPAEGEMEGITISLSVSAEVADNTDNPNMKKLALDLSFSSPDEGSYEIEASVEGVFLFDDGTGEEYINEYLARYAPNEVYAAAASSIKAATASFPYGPAVMPGFNITLDPEKVRGVEIAG